MKTTSTKQFNLRNYFGPTMIFVSCLGIGHNLTNEYFYDKANHTILIMMVCFLVAGIASVLKEKYSK